MSIFSAYASYYDLFYRDRDCAGDVRYIESICARRDAAISRVLDVGCGTGCHLEQFLAAGYSVTGIDASPSMLAHARERCAGDAVTLCEADARNFDLGESFDLVVSLFHIVSYLTTDEDLSAAFACVNRHLDPGGLFVFDAWYGPAVLAQGPSDRDHRYVADDRVVERKARPVLHADRNCVDVAFEVNVESAGTVETIRETHVLRYLFEDEVRALLEAAGMQLAGCEEWLTGRAPGPDTWGVCFIAHA